MAMKSASTPIVSEKAGDGERAHAGYGITHTLEETAQMMGLTRERVRQIEKRALEKLRAAFKRRYGITNVSEAI